MLIPKITLETKTFELKKASAMELLSSINEYFIVIPTICSPGDKEFVSGNVNFNEHTFSVRPIITDWWGRSFLVSTYGTVTNEYIKVDFQTSAFSFILPSIFYISVMLVFLSEAWFQIVWITIPSLIALLIFIFFRARRQYKRDRQNHIDFLNKINIQQQAL